MVWEYTTLQLVATGFEDADQNENYQKILADYGKNGWEIVSTVMYNGQVAGQIIVIFFKKPKGQ